MCLFCCTFLNGMIVLSMPNFTQKEIEVLFGRDAVLKSNFTLAVVEKDSAVQVQITVDNVGEVGYTVKEVNN